VALVPASDAQPPFQAPAEKATDSWSGMPLRWSGSAAGGYGTLPMPFGSDRQDILSNEFDDLLARLEESWREPAFVWQQIVRELGGEQ